MTSLITVILNAFTVIVVCCTVIDCVNTICKAWVDSTKLNTLEGLKILFESKEDDE